MPRERFELACIILSSQCGYTHVCNIILMLRWKILRCYQEETTSFDVDADTNANATSVHYSDASLNSTISWNFESSVSFKIIIFCLTHLRLYSQINQDTISLHPSSQIFYHFNKFWQMDDKFRFWHIDLVSMA